MKKIEVLRRDSEDPAVLAKRARFQSKLDELRNLLQKEEYETIVDELYLPDAEMDRDKQLVRLAENRDYYFPLIEEIETHSNAWGNSMFLEYYCPMITTDDFPDDCGIHLQEQDGTLYILPLPVSQAMKPAVRKATSAGEKLAKAGGLAPLVCDQLIRLKATLMDDVEAESPGVSPIVQRILKGISWQDADNYLWYCEPDYDEEEDALPIEFVELDDDELGHLADALEIDPVAIACICDEYFLCIDKQAQEADPEVYFVDSSEPEDFQKMLLSEALGLHLKLVEK